MRVEVVILVNSLISNLLQSLCHSALVNAFINSLMRELRTKSSSEVVLHYWTLVRECLPYIRSCGKMAWHINLQSRRQPPSTNLRFLTWIKVDLSGWFSSCQLSGEVWNLPIISSLALSSKGIKRRPHTIAMPGLT